MKKKKVRKPKPYKTAASVTILRPAEMTARGAGEVAKWLRRQAGFVLKFRKHLADKRFTASYRYAA